MKCKEDGSEMEVDKISFLPRLDGSVGLKFYCFKCDWMAIVEYRPMGLVRWISRRHGHNTNI